jgi:hypothetical protein
VTVQLAAQTTEENLLMMVDERIVPRELVAPMKGVADEVLEESVKWTDTVVLLEGKIIVYLFRNRALLTRI